MTDCATRPRAVVMELADFMDLIELTNFAELTELTQKDRTPGKVQTHGKRVAPSQPTPIYILSMTSMVWNISIGQLGLADGLCSLPAPAHLLINQTRETERSP